MTPKESYFGLLYLLFFLSAPCSHAGLSERNVRHSTSQLSGTSLRQRNSGQDKRASEKNAHRGCAYNLASRDSDCVD